MNNSELIQNIILKDKYPFILDYQIEGVLHIAKNKKAYLGDEMGLGKSLQALISVDHLNKFPCLIIAPNTLKINWFREVEKFIPHRKAFIISSKTKELEPADFYIINYDIVGKMKDLLITKEFKFIVFDESHYIKNSKTQRTKAIKDLIKKINPENILMMSGTLITNRPKELLPQLELLGVVEKIAWSSWDFLMRYTGAFQRTIKGKKVWDFNGSSRTNELYQKMIDGFYIRREVKQVLNELPEKTRTNIYLEIDNRSEYQKAYNDIRKYILETKEKKLKYGSEHLVKIETLKQILAKGKLEAVKEWVNNVIENEKLVLFAHHKEIVTELKNYYPNALFITGEDNITDRDNAVQQFQNDPEKKLIICSIKAASTGLTLTASRNVAFIELVWTPAEHDQAEARCHRMGQKNHVNIYYLLAENTIEDLQIMPLIEKKRDVFNQVARGFEVEENKSLFDEFIEMF